MERYGAIWNVVVQTLDAHISELYRDPAMVFKFLGAFTGAGLIKDSGRFHELLYDLHVRKGYFEPGPLNILMMDKGTLESFVQDKDYQLSEEQKQLIRWAVHYLQRHKNNIIVPNPNPEPGPAAMERWIMLVSSLAAYGFTVTLGHAVTVLWLLKIIGLAEGLSWLHAYGHVSLGGELALDGESISAKIKNYFLHGLREHRRTTASLHYYSMPGLAQFNFGVPMAILGLFLSLMGLHQGYSWFAIGLINIVQGALTRCLGEDSKGHELLLAA